MNARGGIKLYSDIRNIDAAAAGFGSDPGSILYYPEDLGQLKAWAWQLKDSTVSRKMKSVTGSSGFLFLMVNSGF